MENKLINILVIDHDTGSRKLCDRILELKGYNVENALTHADAISKLKEKKFDISIIDINFPDANGLDILKTIKESNINTIPIILTDIDTRESSIEAINHGAYAYITKPVNIDEVLAYVEGALLKQQLQNETKFLSKNLKETTDRLNKALELKTEFISTVSHELKTPLSITREAINIILDKTIGEVNNKQEKILISARENIDRLGRIINGLLDVERIEAGKIELQKTQVDITSLIKKITLSLEPAAKKKSLILKTNLPHKNVDIYVDQDRISQVITNLIANSIKYTEKGSIEILLIDKEKEIECRVSDTGVGIAKEELPKLFDRFQRFRHGSKGGTGLGLSIVKGIVELHKGKICIDSTPGKGTQFVFILPKYSPEELILEYVNNGIISAKEKDSKMSLIIISIDENYKLTKKIQLEELHSILMGMEEAVDNSLRKAGDAVVKVAGEVIVILTGCDKENALRVEGRLEKVIEDFLNEKKILNKIKIIMGCATYPDEAKEDIQLIKKAKTILASI
jgi:signal transduction histidine kinase/GGDEF domain-containing protein